MIRVYGYAAAVAQPNAVILPDGRSLDVFVAGPSDGPALIFHHGSPSSGLLAASFVRAVTDRGLRYVAASRPGYGDSTRQAGRSVADVAADTAGVMDWMEADQ